MNDVFSAILTRHYGRRTVRVWNVDGIARSLHRYHLRWLGARA